MSTFPKLLIKRLDQFLQTPRAKSMGMVNKSELLRHVINEFLDEQEAFWGQNDIPRRRRSLPKGST
jgi:hypothetical protein